MDAIKLGKFISEIRNERKMTQEELAEKLNVGSGKTISKWERGLGMPDFNTLIEISKVLNITLYELSICEKLNNPTLIEETKTKIKSNFDIIKIKAKDKISIIISIIIGIILGINTIYTITYYNTTKVYTIESMDKRFAIDANLTITKDYNIFNLLTITNLEKNLDYLNIPATNIQYEMLDKENRILLETKSTYNSLNLLDNINTAHFTKDVDKDKTPKSNNLIFRIKYLNKEKEIKYIEFKCQLVKKFQNTFHLF